MNNKQEAISKKQEDTNNQQPQHSRNPKSTSLLPTGTHAKAKKPMRISKKIHIIMNPSIGVIQKKEPFPPTIHSKAKKPVISQQSKTWGGAGPPGRAERSGLA
jgi:hypothetical protein